MFIQSSIVFLFSQTIVGQTLLEKPEFSLESGFYVSTISLTCSCNEPGAEIRYTVSIGLTIIDDSSPSLYESWIKTADELLYRAKEAGRNQIVCGSF